MRPLVIIGGYLTNPSSFTELADLLAAPPYNYQVSIAPISRWRWAITRDWDFRAILHIVRATVEEALKTSEATTVDILGYSVGGTVARMYLGEQPYLGEVYAGRRYVQRLTMIGTPHHSVERWTRDSIGFVNRTYPGAFYHNIRYTSVIGHAIHGNPRGTLIQRLASSSYRRVSGSKAAHAVGDGVTTLECAALSGAEYLVVPGVTHSHYHGNPWYGTDAGLRRWGHILHTAET